jgi:hypothetical protein
MARPRPGLEMTLRGAEAPIGPGEVRLDDVEEAVAVTRLVRAAEAAVRDERIQRPRFRRGAVDRGVDLLPDTDVAANGARAGLGRHLLEPREVAREQRQAGAFGGEPLRDRAADPDAAAGDDDVLALHRRALSARCRFRERSYARSPGSSPCSRPRGRSPRVCAGG